MKTSYKINEISKLYGIGFDSLRYYEKLGILSPKREANNYRVYGLDDIWKLNMIKDLRRLDFSMEEIKTYLENRTIESTQELLEKEINLIENKVKELLKIKNTLTKRQEEITNVLDSFVIGKVVEKNLSERKSIILEKTDTKENEMDLMAKQLHAAKEKRITSQQEKRSLEQKLYILGDSILGGMIHPNDYIDTITQKYSGVFMLISPKEKFYHSIIPKGLYLSYHYRGNYSGTWEAIKEIKTYALSKGYVLEGNAMELWEIDIHETSLEKEYLTEVQIKIKE